MNEIKRRPPDRRPPIYRDLLLDLQGNKRRPPDRRAGRVTTIKQSHGTNHALFTVTIGLAHFVQHITKAKVAVNALNMEVVEQRPSPALASVAKRCGLVVVNIYVAQRDNYHVVRISTRLGVDKIPNLLAGYFAVKRKDVGLWFGFYNGLGRCG